MSRNYQREDRDWRRQQPSSQEDDQWSNSRSDDDFSMGLGQESRGSSTGREGMRRGPGQSTGYGPRGESGRGQRFGGSYRGREGDYYGPEEYRGNDLGWDQGNEGFQNSSRWQRSQFPPSRNDFGGTQQAWNERYEGLGGRGWYEGVQDAVHRGEGQFTGRGPRNYKRSDDRIEEDINERLTRHGMVDATDIEVSVQNGEVTLRGSVDNRQAKRIAEDIADAVSGVKEIINQIKVRQRGESNERSDNKPEAEPTGKQQRKAS